MKRRDRRVFYLLLILIVFQLVGRGKNLVFLSDELEDFYGGT
jgi:hypothetical protein